ncbi:MAG: transposase [Pirellulales bacterium]
MLRKPQTIAFWSGRLPHWEVEDGRYFITIHLAGAIPAQGRNRLRQIAEQLRHIEDRQAAQWLRIQRMIFAEMERWLDRAEWNPLLQRRDVAEVVADAIEHRHERGDWQMYEYVVMPTHVHMFCEIGRPGLKGVLEDFKRWTGHCAAKLLSMSAERFWQREWFDHWSRSDDEDDRIIAYMRNNPEKAELVKQYQDWPHASWSRSRLPDGTSKA